MRAGDTAVRLRRAGLGTRGSSLDSRGNLSLALAMSLHCEPRRHAPILPGGEHFWRCFNSRMILNIGNEAFQYSTNSTRVNTIYARTEGTFPSLIHSKHVLCAYQSE
jgi:hypothetical protein